MRRALAFLAFLASFAALAQPISNNCTLPNATCKAKHFVLATGGDLLPPSDLGASLGSSSKRFTSIFAATVKDGSSINRLIWNSAAGDVYVDGFAATGGATDIAHLFNTHVTWTNGRLACFENSGTEELCIGYDGKIRGTFTTPQTIDMSYASNGIKLSTGSTAGGDIYLTDKDGVIFLHANKNQITAQSVENPIPVVHVAQTANPVAMEFGHSAASGAGALAVTFATAFGAAPTCVCTDENAVPVVCGATTAASTTGVTFSVTVARADTLDWYCIGTK